MKTRLLIIIGIVVISTITVIVFSILFGVSHIFDNSSAYQVLDVKMNVIGIKQFYEIGEPLSFSVYVSSLGKTVPWPTLRIYQNYVDISSEPAYSRMYMTPIESEDKQKSVEWRERMWDFPLEPDHSIRFFDKGNYTLRVDVDAKKHILINFQVIDSINEFIFSFCGSDGFDSEGNLNSDNSTHHWDENECDWEYIGPATNSINKWPGAPIYKEQQENKKPILTPEQIDEQIDIVFGNARKSWTVFPGGAGYVPPENSTLVRIYKEVNFGITPLNFTAMLDDKIFVNKCESNDGVWNYTYHDCEILESECVDLGGIMISRGISVPCTGEICLDRKVYRMSCVFEYEN